MSTVSELASEVRALREGCGLVDRSERGKLALTGVEAKPFLSGQVTNDIEGLSPGHGCYAALLTHKGKMIADLRVLDLGSELWLDTERVALQALFDALRRHLIGFDAELHKRTLEQGLLSLVGPSARELGAGGRPRRRGALQRERTCCRRRRHARHDRHRRRRRLRRAGHGGGEGGRWSTRARRR